MEGISRSTPVAVHDEEGLDQVAGGEVMFPDETPHRLGTPAAARPENRLVGHGRKTITARPLPLRDVPGGSDLLNPSRVARVQ